MRRLFVAIPVSPKTFPQGEEILKNLSLYCDENGISIKPTRPENYHITLKFLGDIADNKREQIKHALSRFARPAFKINLSQLGVFSSVDKAKVLFAGVAPNPDLLEWQTAIAGGLSQLLGIKAESNYSPHLTLARFPKPPDLAAFIQSQESFSVTHEVDKLCLYESTPGDGFPVYSKLATIPLGPKP